MTPDRLEELLKRADQLAPAPAPLSVAVSTLRRRAGRRRFTAVAVPASVAAVVLFALCICSLVARKPKTTPEADKLVAMDTRIVQLQARIDAAVALIHEVLEQESRERRMELLEAQLSAIPDPTDEMQRQTDRTASILVYQADRLHRELNQTSAAIETYNRVIRLFPENRWAEVSRQRLTEIENRKFNKVDFEGDTKWKPKNV